MKLDFDNDDFILGLLAAKEEPSLWIEWVATGCFEHSSGCIFYEWQLISVGDLDVHVLVLKNSEGGVEWKCKLSGITKTEVTNGMIDPFRAGEMGGLPALDRILTGQNVSVSKKWVSKPLLVRAIKEGRKGQPERFLASEWAERVGLN
jgi:hypothetical protein